MVMVVAENLKISFKMAAMGGLGHISLVSLSHLSVFPSNFYSSSNIVVLCIVL